MVKGAVCGAATVGLLAGLLGELIRDVHPIVIGIFAAFGAIAGALAWGVVAYEHEHDPSIELASSDEPVGERPRESGLHWLWRRHGASLVRFPLAPWI